jgi:hypothetical protein
MKTDFHAADAGKQEGGGEKFQGKERLTVIFLKYPETEQVGN